MADEVMVELVRDELQRISDSGQLASRALLREQVGVGARDLDRALDVLRERGEASEVEPDGFRMSREDVQDAPDAPPAVAAPQRTGDTRERISRVGDVEFAREATVTMPRAMVDAIDADALGKILKAGIDAAPAGLSFVFEVTP